LDLRVNATMIMTTRTSTYMDENNCSSMFGTCIYYQRLQWLNCCHRYSSRSEAILGAEQEINEPRDE